MSARRARTGGSGRVPRRAYAFAAVVLGAAAAMAVLAREPRSPSEPSATLAGSSAGVAGTRPAGPALEARLVSLAPEANGGSERLALPRAAAPAPVSDDLGPDEAPSRGSEREHYERFLAQLEQLAQAGGDAGVGTEAEALVSQVLGGAAENEQVALLRALWDSRSPLAAGCFARVLARPEEARALGAPWRDHGSPASFALSFLSQRAASEPAALALLADFAGAPPPGADEARLRRAALIVDALSAGEGDALQPPRAYAESRDINPPGAWVSGPEE